MDNNDRLILAKDAKVAKLLSTLGSKKLAPEKVQFSDLVIKINRKGKEQTRCVLVTDHALYNLKATNFGKCQRRIPLEKIVSVTVSSVSEEFVLHVPEEYDYHFKSAQRERLLNTIRQGGSAFSTLSLAQVSLITLVINQKTAAKMTQIQKLKRKQELEAIGKVTAVVRTPKVASVTPPHDFEFIAVLGRGKFAKVMQVRKKSNGKIYAMKILRKAAVVGRDCVEHTMAERGVLQKLHHPFLMALRFAFQSKDKLYMVLDYFPGGELYFHLKQQRRFSEEIARLWVAEVALAFGYLHSFGVVYRDLKPENILLDDAGHVCLTDFGEVKELQTGGKTHTFCGTPEYMAPEVIEGDGHDKNVDWWALGVLLYELTVGIPPFYSANVGEMYDKIQNAPLRFSPNQSPECRELITALLHRDPRKRLGYEKDVDDIKSSSFFSMQPGWDWDKVYHKQVESPFKVRVDGLLDTRNFDQEFVQEPVVDSPVDSAQSLLMDFANFTFLGDSVLEDKENVSSSAANSSNNTTTNNNSNNVDSEMSSVASPTERNSTTGSSSRRGSSNGSSNSSSSSSDVTTNSAPPGGPRLSNSAEQSFE